LHLLVELEQLLLDAAQLLLGHGLHLAVPGGIGRQRREIVALRLGLLQSEDPLDGRREIRVFARHARETLGVLRPLPRHQRRQLLMALHDPRQLAFDAHRFVESSGSSTASPNSRASKRSASARSAGPAAAISRSPAVGSWSSRLIRSRVAVAASAGRSASTSSRNTSKRWRKATMA